MWISAENTFFDKIGNSTHNNSNHAIIRQFILQTEQYTYRGKKSQPCCTHDAIENHKQ